MHPLIELEHVFFAYDHDDILTDISLTVEQGDFLALIGPNGSGKTTLLKIILGLLPPRQGKVLVFGKKPSQLNSRRSQIGYVPQNNSVDFRFPINVYDFILTGRFALIGPGKRPSSEDRKAVERTLEVVALESLQRMQIGKISGGQRQKMLIARALVHDPKILILDEPTTAVDLKSSETFYELLKKLRQWGMSILMVSHDVGVVARYADRIACINRQLVVHGRPEEIITAEILKKMYGKEAAFFHHGAIPHIVVGREPDERFARSTNGEK
ncbi:MAG TPA: metal ABC transporter ATP-binding protein [Atribacteraceae bacterium]|nr:metal ABC transporter ATP-binding protein [Atribacteraceae bacterium]